MHHPPSWQEHQLLKASICIADDLTSFHMLALQILQIGAACIRCVSCHMSLSLSFSTQLSPALFHAG